MKKLFLLMILFIVLMLRFSLSVRVTEIFQKEVYRMNLSLEDGRIKVLKINNKYPLKNIYGKLGYKENGKYEGYFLIKSIKEYENIYFVELEDVKSTRIEDSFLEKYFGRGNKLSDLMEALTENRIDEYEEKLQEILLTSVSYNDTKKGNEAFYHGLIMGMGLYLEGEYITKSNIESGLGRYDFSVEPKNKNKRAFIMEFKSTDSVEKLEEVSKEALEQIENKKYDISLKQNGIKQITYIEIAFCGKEIKISYK